jgi:uncharacterized membrane protein
MHHLALAVSVSLLAFTVPAQARPMFMGLGDLPGGGSNEAMAVSADGSIIAGTISGDEAFIRQNGVVTGFGDLLGGQVVSIARGISADGSTVVGASNSALGREAHRWTTQGGMVGDAGSTIGLNDPTTARIWSLASSTWRRSSA